MAINLEKGATLNLTKQAKGLTNVLVELGWAGDGDLDLMAFATKSNGKVPSDGYFAFFNQMTSDDGAIELDGDERGGDDEQTESLHINLSGVNAQVEKVALVAHIYDWSTSGATYGDVSNAYIRIVDESTGNELVRYDLEEDFSSEITVHFAEIYRDGAEWQFRAIGKGTQEDLGKLAKGYGVNVG